jgi:NADH-quinone oxidoreductase subunit G
MATIHVDGKQYEVDGSDNLLQACLSLGLDVPYFCWHPALGSVGACRQCAVKQYANADDKRGRLVMSCMTPATDNSWISIDDSEARDFRKSVVEWLMTNHPHDCPVCEEGGHCHLQDMTVMTGHSTRRYRFTKRTHVNQNLGPFINHEMNRCIACYRCVRYYKDYAGGTDLGVYGAHENVYFGRVADGNLESEFSGNLTEVCPTGVFTDKTHSERYNRKWDMQFAPSVCQGCSVGCNISPGERYGELRRIENRYNGAVNHYFICDRGRFGYGFVNLENRPKQPWVVTGNAHVALGIDTALDAAAERLLKTQRMIGIGSPRASLEANFALRELVGAENFHSGMTAEEQALVTRAFDVLAHGAARTPSLREIESCDAVLVLGEDVTQTAPRIALSLRQSVRLRERQLAASRKVAEWHAEAVKSIGDGELSPLFITSFAATRLDDVARARLRADADTQARLGFAVAHLIDGSAPGVDHLDDSARALANEIAEALMAASKPLVVAGTSSGNIATIDAAANIVRALAAKGKQPAISLVVPEVNSLGVAMIGGQSLDDALQLLASGKADSVVILENDLYNRAPAGAVNAALGRAAVIVVVDHQQTRTLEKAHVGFSAASFAENDGTVVSNEGRAQRFYQVFDPGYYNPQTQVRESWRWLHALQATLKRCAVSWQDLDDVTGALAAAVPALAGIVRAAPDASFRLQGMKIARSPRRYSGRTAMRANLSVHEPRASQDADSALAFSMEGLSGPNNESPLIPFAWAPGWNSPQAWNKFQDEVGGNLRSGDSGVRLIENDASAAYRNAPDRQPAAERQLVPTYHIFGSEELSSRTAPMQKRMPAPHVVVGDEDARALALREGEVISVKVEGVTLELPAKLDPSLARGLVGLPFGLPGMPPLPFSGSVQLRKGGQQ